MADTIREQILTALKARLESITVTNGYNTDSGDNVFRVQPIVNAEDLPALTITDEAEQVRLQYGAHNATLRVIVSAIDKRDEVYGGSEMANLLLGDVIKCVIGGDRTYGGLAVSTEYTQSQPTFPESGGEVTVIGVEFDIVYEFNLGDPYNQ